jgi:hypothetical protein
MTEREFLILRAKAMWGGFYYCPTTGFIIETLPGDDKAICGCRRSNPACRSERAEATGVHIVRFLVPATAEEYVDARWPIVKGV